MTRKRKESSGKGAKFIVLETSMAIKLVLREYGFPTKVNTIIFRHSGFGDESIFG